MSLLIVFAITLDDVFTKTAVHSIVGSTLLRLSVPRSWALVPPSTIFRRDELDMLAFGHPPTFYVQSSSNATYWTAWFCPLPQTLRPMRDLLDRLLLPPLPNRQRSYDYGYA